MDGGGIIVLFLVAAVGLLIYVVWRYLHDRQIEKHGQRHETPARVQAAGPEVEIAVIKEEIEITSWGNFSRIALAIAIVIETFGVLGASNYFQAIQAGVAFIGSAILFGLGVALGRKRTYRIYRTDAADKGLTFPR
jgi:hypothetical protein